MLDAVRPEGTKRALALAVYTIPQYGIFRIIISKKIMAHTIKEKSRLLGRVRRIRGQIEALERALESEKECVELLQQIAAARGAINGLMVEVVEDHVRTHVASPSIDTEAQRRQGTDELIEIIRTYLK